MGAQESRQFPACVVCSTESRYGIACERCSKAVYCSPQCRTRHLDVCVTPRKLFHNDDDPRLVNFGNETRHLPLQNGGQVEVRNSVPIRFSLWELHHNLHIILPMHLIAPDLYPAVWEFTPFRPIAQLRDAALAIMEGGDLNEQLTAYADSISNTMGRMEDIIEALDRADDEESREAAEEELEVLNINSIIFFVLNWATGGRAFAFIPENPFEDEQPMFTLEFPPYQPPQ